jgi:GxxExxY protein
MAEPAKARLLHEEESYAVIGACFEVYREKGCGFLEAVYQECMVIELRLRGIPFEEQPTLSLAYKAHDLQQTYQPDFVCYGRIVVELKAVSALTDEHRAQLHNYLKASGLRLGLLMNFGHYPKLEYERIIR